VFTRYNGGKALPQKLIDNI
jgi:hypothetical protein